MMSRKPSKSSVLFEPTDMKTVDTFVAMPTVYWMSRFCSGSHVSDVALNDGMATYGFNTSLVTALWVLTAVESLEGERGRRGDVCAVASQECLRYMLGCL